MKSYLINLECTYCGEIYSPDEPHSICFVCDKVLYARYDIEAAGKELTQASLADRLPNMWRYFEVMPIRDESNVVSLGEGFTPILQVDRLAKLVGASHLLIKDEGLNPTGSFKVRGLSASVSKAKELGLTRLTMPTAGNAGGALAAYAARAGAEAHVFMPKDAPEANQKEVTLNGANLNLVDGLISDAGKRSRELAQKENLFDVSTLQEPYRVEGKKTMGYEIAEQLGWKMPDVIVYPTGGGTGIVGIWKAVEEMERLGWISSSRPRLFAIQAEGCAPIVKAFHSGSEFAEPWVDAHTIAAGLRVPSAIGDYLILRALRESNGGAITVTDQEIIDWTKISTSSEGVQVCPEGAATVVATRKLIQGGEVSKEESILLLNTASPLKYMDLF